MDLIRIGSRTSRAIWESKPGERARRAFQERDTGEQSRESFPRREDPGERFWSNAFEDCTLREQSREIKQRSNPMKQPDRAAE